MMPRTASTFARRMARAAIGAAAMRSGASSPEIVSQARPPASCPAAMTSTGTSRLNAPSPLFEKLRHSSTAGGTR
jgi:hypothetical protein